CLHSLFSLVLYLAAPIGAAVSVTLSVTPNPAAPGAPVQLSAAVQGCAPSAGARVTFYDGVTVLGASPLGSASPFRTTLPPGVRKLRAYYAGDSACAASS